LARLRTSGDATRINAHMIRSIDHESAVAYDALDPELQLWVAACMFRVSSTP